MLVLITFPASAQYGPTVPGTLGSGSRPAQLAPLPTGTDTPGRGQRSWEIIPTLSLDETYTDNVRLGPPGSERGDWVTRLSPGVSVNGRGARLRFNATYSANTVYRAQEGSNDLFHNLNANGDAELVQQLLFVDTRATVSQANVSVLGPQAESNVNNNANRTTVRTFFLSPYLRHDFGNDAQGEARLTYSTVESGSAGNATNSASNRIDTRLFSGPAYKLFTWNLAYSKEHIDYSTTTQSIDTERVSAYGRRLITPNLGLQATVGYEDNNYGISATPSKGAFWSVGPEWTPTPRTRLAATTGRHYYGPSHSLDFSHRTRLTTWSISYKEETTTTRGQFLVPSTVDTAGYLDTLFLSRIPDPVARQTAVQNFMNQTGLPASMAVPLNFFSTTAFLMKSWQASFGIQGVRNTVLANVFTIDREAVAANQFGAGDFGLTSSTRQTGTSLLWSSRITEQTTSNSTIGYTLSEIPGLAREDKTTYIRLGLTKQFQPKLTGTLSYRRLHNESNQAASGYTENALSALLNMRF